MLILSGFFFPDPTGNSPTGAADAGWTSYPPLSARGPFGQSLWLVGVIILGSSSILGSMNFLVTILNMRTPGMTMHRMPLFVWAMLTTSFIQLIATPALAAALLMVLADRHLGTHFFDPAGGGDVLGYQHGFWFYSHPAVYIMILPYFGIISEVLQVFSRKPIFGYKAVAYSTAAIGVLGFLVWAHHMFTVGLPVISQSFFMLMTMLIAIPTGIKIFNWAGHAVGRPPAVQGAAAVRARLPDHVRHRRHQRRLLGRRARRLPAARHVLHRRATSTTCSSAAACSPSSRAPTTGSPRSPAACTARAWAPGTSG